MNTGDRPDELRRILIALDASPASQAALELAVDLAARHKAELVGIFVEDVNLIRSADISFTVEVGEFSAIPRQVDRLIVEHEMKAHARRIEEMLASIAGRANLRWTFRSVRGLIPGEIITAAEGTDLVILGKKGWSEGKQMGSTARKLAALSPVQSLILKQGVQPGTPVLVIYDGSPESMKAIKAAGRICTPGSTLTILVPAEDQEAAQDIHAGLSAWIEEQDFDIKFRWMNDLEGKRISNLALISGCEIVILPVESKHFQPEAIISLVENADCAVLLVR